MWYPQCVQPPWSLILVYDLSRVQSLYDFEGPSSQFHIISKLVFYLNWKPEDCLHKPIHFCRCFQEYLAVFLSGTYPSVLESSLWTTSATDVFQDSEIEFLPPDLKGHFLCYLSPKSNYDCLVSNGSRVIITFFNFLSHLNEKDKTLHVGRTSSITEHY